MTPNPWQHSITTGDLCLSILCKEKEEEEEDEEKEKKRAKEMKKGKKIKRREWRGKMTEKKKERI